MSKVHEDNAGYFGVSHEETQDPFYSYNKLALPIVGSDRTILRDEVTFTVTVAGGKFVIDGTSQATVSLLEGNVYTFDQSNSSNGSHPLKFSYTADGTHGGGLEYTLGVTTNGTPGQAGAYTRIVVPFGLHDLKYYCGNHSGMGGSANVAKNTEAFTVGRPIYVTSDAFGKTDPAIDTSQYENTYVLSINPSYGGASSVVYNANQAYAQSNDSGYQSVTIYFNPAIQNVTNVKYVGGSQYSSGEYILKINGSQVGGTRTTNSNYAEESVDITSTNVTSMTVQTVGNGNGYTLGSLKFNDTNRSGTTIGAGELLVGQDPFKTSNSSATQLRLALPMNGANSGTEFLDKSGLNISVSRTGAVTKTDQSIFYGSSGYFNGSSYLDLGGLAPPPYSDIQDFTFECWVRPDGTSQYGFITNANSDNDNGRMRIGTGNGGGFWMKIGSSSLSSANGTFPANTWSHLAVVRKEGIVTAYVNGVSIGTMANNDGITQSSWRVGYTYRSGTVYAFSGYMQDVRFYNTAKYVTPFPSGRYGMDVVNYTGNQSNRSFILNHRPDLVWIKAKENGFHHQLFDSVRGVNLRLQSSHDGAQATASNSLTAFNSNGFSLGTDNNGDVNGGGPTNYTAWTWKAGGQPTADNSAGIGQTPTSGSVMIDGVVSTSAQAGTHNFKRISASNTYGFSIVKFQGTDNGVYPTGLQTTPNFLIYKDIDAGQWWRVFHSDLSSGKTLYLNQDYDESADNDRVTAVSANTFTVGNVVDDDNYIAYIWSEREGFSKFGNFSHDGSSGQTLDFGFVPRWWLVKEKDGNTNWYIFDATRDNFDDPFFAETTSNASSGWGFTFSGTTVTWVGGSFAAGNYIYAAFAESAAGEGFESHIVDELGLEDLSGNDNNASNVGATWQTSVKKFYGGATDFNGSSSVVTVPYSSDFDPGTGDYTVELWAHWDSNQSGTLLSWHGGNVSARWDLGCLATGTLRFFIHNGTLHKIETTVLTSQWLHIVAQRRGDTMELFVNGSPAGALAISGSWPAGSSGLFIGCRNPSTGNVAHMNGYIQDVRIYKGIAKYSSSFSPPERSVQGTARRHPSGIYVIS